MTTENSDYYRARAGEERARAADCGDPSIASIHLELAAKYETLAEERISPFAPDRFDSVPSLGRA